MDEAAAIMSHRISYPGRIAPDDRTPEQITRDSQRMQINDAAKSQYAGIQQFLLKNPSLKMQVEREFNLPRNGVTKDMSPEDLSGLVQRMSAAAQKYRIGPNGTQLPAPAPAPSRAISAPPNGLQAAPSATQKPSENAAAALANGPFTGVLPGVMGTLANAGFVKAPQSVRDNAAATGIVPPSKVAVSDAAAQETNHGTDAFASLDPVAAMEQRMQKQGWNTRLPNKDGTPSKGLQQDGGGYYVEQNGKKLAVQPTGTMAMDSFKQRTGLESLSPTIDPRTGKTADPETGGRSALGDAIMRNAPEPSGPYATSGQYMKQTTDAAGNSTFTLSPNNERIGDGGFKQSPVALLPSQPAAEGKGVDMGGGRRQISGLYGSGFATGVTPTGIPAATPTPAVTPAKPMTPSQQAGQLAGGNTADPNSVASQAKDKTNAAAPMPATSPVGTKGTGLEAANALPLLGGTPASPFAGLAMQGTTNALAGSAAADAQASQEAQKKIAANAQAEAGGQKTQDAYDALRNQAQKASTQSDFDKWRASNPHSPVEMWPGISKVTY
jgi:hypothetical protein